MEIHQDINIRNIQLITAEQAWTYRIVPFGQSMEQVDIYIDKSFFGNGIQDELELIFNKGIQLHPLESKVLEPLLIKYYRRSSGEGQQIRHFNIYDEHFLEGLIEEARSVNASDIHFEPFEDYARIRLRIDGKLIERFQIEMDKYPSIVNRIKIFARIDIAEKRLPQDGRITITNNLGTFDLRTSTLPTMYGEKIVLRILARDSNTIDLEELGFSDTQLQGYLESVSKPNGIILISGPTGSGKTTTLYATLKRLNTKDTNILTVEDPVEYTLEGINQVQLKENIGLTFSRALRTFLRQDPDIIMLGEIRDTETAQMAIRAALTGHLVFSTIHTNSAWGTISRLLDMNVPPYLLSGTLNMSAAQRLLRLLCNSCKSHIDEQDSEQFPEDISRKIDNNKIYKPVGCPDCHYTGYKGRKAIYELIPIDKEIAEVIRNKEEINSKRLTEKGVKSLAEQALQLFCDGKTSYAEIYPVLISSL
ncbi:MAG: type II/IV secretion system protein [Bacteroidales bacterium]|nr:type II/IV secretion system protein [Bacteroidales bacterium]